MEAVALVAKQVMDERVWKTAQQLELDMPASAEMDTQRINLLGERWHAGDRQAVRGILRAWVRQVDVRHDGVSVVIPVHAKLHSGVRECNLTLYV